MIHVHSRPARFLLGMLAYVALGVLAAATLDDWRFRTAVLIVLAALAVKTWISERTRE